MHDYAFAMVGAGGKSGTAQLDSTVGGHPIQFSAVSGGADTYLFGYPAAGKYRGNDLVYCRGPLGFDPNVANATYRVGCNMTGGSSGGGWYTPFGGGSGTLVSVNSYGYSGITAMHGPEAQRRDAVDVRHGRVGDQQHDRSLIVRRHGRADVVRRRSQGRRARVRSAARSGLPVASSGIASTTMTRSGVLNRATPRSANHVRHASRSKPAGSTTNAHTRSPRSASGSPTATAWRTSGMRLQQLLDLGDADVLAAPDDHVLHAADDVDRAVGRDRGEVAGAEPAVGGERLRGLRGVEIADAHLGAAHEQLAVGVDAELDRPDRMAVGDDRRALRSSRTCASLARRTRADASATNASLTPAPPLEIRRRLATRSVEKPGACIIERKNVGGPTMNVTRSRSMRSSACSGSQRAMNTVRNGTTPGSVTPFSRPEMCAAGAGMSTQSSVPRSCSCCICAALYTSVPGCAARPWVRRSIPT